MELRNENSSGAYGVEETVRSKGTGVRDPALSALLGLARRRSIRGSTVPFQESGCRDMRAFRPIFRLTSWRSCWMERRAQAQPRVAIWRYSFC
jgi:hypothetical protein